MSDHEHDHDLVNRGLAFDLGTLVRRRRMLGLFGAAGVATLAGCTSDGSGGGSGGGGSGSGGPASGPTATAPSSSTAAGTGKIPEETAGPYPGDGSNGPNVLTRSGIVRSDIRSSFGSASGTAAGVPLTINLTILDTGNGGAAYPGAAVYVWQCDREARYSMYSQGVTAENYLRGVQAADGNGRLTFRTIFPAAYPGRWPHIHFEVYPSIGSATSANNKIATSQLALPEVVCNAVYATEGYGASARTMSRTSLANDTVFRDDRAQDQLATVTGSVAQGYTASLRVPV